MRKFKKILGILLIISILIITIVVGLTHFNYIKINNELVQDFCSGLFTELIGFIITSIVIAMALNFLDKKKDYKDLTSDILGHWIELIDNSERPISVIQIFKEENKIIITGKNYNSNLEEIYEFNSDKLLISANLDSLMYTFISVHIQSKQQDLGYGFKEILKINEKFTIQKGHYISARQNSEQRNLKMIRPNIEKKDDENMKIYLAGLIQQAWDKNSKKWKI